MGDPKCPVCKGPLISVVYPHGSMFNKEQWESMRAGDYYCSTCKSDAATTGYKYYWKHEIDTKVEMNWGDSISEHQSELLTKANARIRELEESLAASERKVSEMRKLLTKAEPPEERTYE